MHCSSSSRGDFEDLKAASLAQSMPGQGTAHQGSLYLPFAQVQGTYAATLET
jgi:hypothetical protein